MSFQLNTPLLIILLLLVFSCSKEENTLPAKPTTFYKGMDLSFQSELETYNITYRDETNESVNLLNYLASKGTNLVRLRLWHTPLNGQNTLEKLKLYAQKVSSQQMDLLLNIHYSDSWADPSTQTPPLAWQNLSFESLKLEVYNYTKTVVQELKNQNTLPTIIQIGNETDSGFLWDYGKVWDNFNTNWENYANLVSQAIRAIRELDTENKIKIMLHHSSVENAIYFFNELQPFQIDFDIIGLSYYPQYNSKNLNLITTKLNELALTFNKHILMTEVAYPFTLQWNDNSTNLVGNTNQLLSEFPASPQGQKAYLNWLINTLKQLPNKRGIGFCYWAPDWVAFNGNASTSTNGSAWENQCLFDFNHKALPAIAVFKAE